MPSQKARAAAAAAAAAAPAVRSKAHRGPSSQGPSSDGRARIAIHITNHYAAKVYTTGAPITGEAVIRVPRDTHFHRIAIQFAGIAATRNYMTPEIDQVQHHFLLLDMPVQKSHPSLLPADGILRAGQTYALPFHFVVPDGLPIGSCNQRCEHPSVREHHLRLPPTMRAWGDRDDGSPDTARVQYCISVSVLQRTVFMPEPISVLRGHREVNILPAYAEDAPLDVELGDKGGEYKLEASKVLRRTLVSRKVGTVAMQAAQPAAIVLSSDAREASPARIALNLRFVPADRISGAISTGSEASMPAVHSITAKLVARTYYNTSHMGAFPDRNRARHELNFGASLYYSDTSRATNVPFASSADGWQQQKEKDEARAWETTLDAAFQLPIDHRKILLPTFHSCLLSRTYTLRLVLCIGPGRTSVALSLPLQIVVQADVSAVPQHVPDGDVSECGEIDVALPTYKDHLYVQKRYEEETHTSIPLGGGILL
ncbi:arrestin [Akanthomyces lecanii RCEF 1005]|uniref:Arrestin n=1 Tax=Akanthomyces lecanii RCEF 1005 TaxID=1081108 RepID=A0A168H1V8_CORDF|nr:arrestin [Akanthomyces lecanii RCEF 1005]